MTKQERISELIASMKSFCKDRYQREELLTEMFTLQKEIVELTFNGEHASTADLKIWDVEKHLAQMNEECGGIANEALQQFKDSSKTFCNLIKAEISGTRGEARAFRALQFIRNKSIILKNIELCDGDLRTELDAVVIMQGTIVIVEVKNTSKDIFIDENGDYYRTGEFLRWDCNIAEKMATKETLLRRALEREGIQDVQLKSIVVFTDNRIEVHNKYSSIKTCFGSQLAYMIDGLSVDRSTPDDRLVQMENAIRNAETKEAYPFEFDVDRYKREFATLMATLEEASSHKDTVSNDEEVDNVQEEKSGLVKNFFKSKFAGLAGSMAAGAAVAFVSTVVMSTIRKGGFFR